MMKKRFVKCPDCGKKIKHYAYGRCRTCYQRLYVKTHPEYRERIKEYQRTKYREDEEYRLNVLEKRREYNKTPEEKKRMADYQRKYLKEHPPRSRFERRRTGLLCPCGGIDKADLGGKLPKNINSQRNRCPHCGKHTVKKKVLYDRLTNVIIKELC